MQKYFKSYLLKLVGKFQVLFVLRALNWQFSEFCSDEKVIAQLEMPYFGY